MVRQRSLVPPCVGSNPSAPAFFLMKTRIIFVTGGVVSSIGKGIASAAIGCILRCCGYSVNIKKLDPYLNVDPGTMNPAQHGEVFVTNDGAETDLDLGHYERFVDINMSRDNNITTGKIYQDLIEKERSGFYLGKTVQVVPHVTDLIKEFVLKDADKTDFLIIEIGGTVGDIEGQPFLEAIRQLSLQLGKAHTLFTHLTLIPFLGKSGEVKTKPTQHSVRDLMYSGIEANILLCRTSVPLSQGDKDKIGLFCNISSANVIEAPDVDNVYELPYIYSKNGLQSAIFQHFGLECKYQGCSLKVHECNIAKWHNYAQKAQNATKTINILLVGKYSIASDCYKSVIEAVNHSATSLDAKVNIKWGDTRLTNDSNVVDLFKDVDCVVVTGGFGQEGIEGYLAIIKYARENNIPTLGICYGMQLAVVEFARNVAGISNANSTEIDKNTADPIVGLITEWVNKEGQIETRDLNTKVGGTMRLGSYEAFVKEGTLAHKLYSSSVIQERHRHRYEINHNYISQIEKHGAIFSSFSVQNSTLPEMFELPNHKFFITCQFHPEFLSRPFKPHPLFSGLLQAGLKK